MKSVLHTLNRATAAAFLLLVGVTKVYATYVTTQIDSTLTGVTYDDCVQIRNYLYEDTNYAQFCSTNVGPNCTSHEEGVYFGPAGFQPHYDASNSSCYVTVLCWCS